jgi:hypothetical protein
VIILSEKKIVEADDKFVQKMAYDLFCYLSVRGLPKGRRMPEFDEMIRKAHAKQFQEGVEEFTSALSNYLAGYARSMEHDENKYRADYDSVIYKALSQALAKI